MEQFDDIPIEPVKEPAYKPSSAFHFTFSRMTGDMQFVGIFTIVYGVLCCLTIVGAVAGVPLIFAGLKIRDAADQFSFFSSSNNNAALKAGFELQAKYFKIFKILIIVGIIIMVLYLILLIIFLSMGISSLLDLNSLPQS